MTIFSHRFFRLALLSVLFSGGGSLGIAHAVEASKPGGGAGFSAACLACNNDCETQYPTPLGPQQTCKRICVDSGTCPAPATTTVPKRPINAKPVGKMAPDAPSK